MPQWRSAKSQSRPATAISRGRRTGSSQMADPGTTTSVPQSGGVRHKRARLSLVWIIPIVAAAIGCWVALTRILSEGPDITITLFSAEGLEAGKTKIRYKGVDVGTVNTIRLSEDHMRVTAK